MTTPASRLAAVKRLRAAEGRGALKRIHPRTTTATCTACGRQFETCGTKPRRTCSRECQRERSRQGARPESLTRWIKP